MIALVLALCPKAPRAERVSTDLPVPTAAKVATVSQATPARTDDAVSQVLTVFPACRANPVAQAFTVCPAMRDLKAAVATRVKTVSLVGLADPVSLARSADQVLKVLADLQEMMVTTALKVLGVIGARPDSLETAASLVNLVTKVDQVPTVKTAFLVKLVLEATTVSGARGENLAVPVLKVRPALKVKLVWPAFKASREGLELPVKMVLPVLRVSRVTQVGLELLVSWLLCHPSRLLGKRSGLTWASCCLRTDTTT